MLLLLLLPLLLLTGVVQYHAEGGENDVDKAAFAVDTGTCCC